jgi:hypothetical protein
MYTKSRQLGVAQPRYLFESALIEVSQAVGRLLTEVKGGQMDIMEDGELSWMVVFTFRGSHVANLEEIEIQLFDRTWEEGLLGGCRQPCPPCVPPPCGAGGEGNAPRLLGTPG